MLRQYWEGRWRTRAENAAGSLGLTAIGAPYEAGASEDAYRAIFARAAKEGADGLYLSPALETVVRRRLIAELALSAGMASVSHYRDNVEAGGLMSYGADLADIYRRSARYIDRILRGADPGEMPFQQPTKFDLTLNMATAAALGLEIPPTLLALADDVFE
jgi:putative ABC transport system substrate-binding protein